MRKLLLAIICTIACLSFVFFPRTEDPLQDLNDKKMITLMIDNAGSRHPGMLSQEQNEKAFKIIKAWLVTRQEWSENFTIDDFDITSGIEAVYFSFEFKVKKGNKQCRQYYIEMSSLKKIDIGFFDDEIND